LLGSDYFNQKEQQVPLYQPAFEEVSINHETRSSNTHSRNLALNFLSLHHGFHLWLLNSHDASGGATVLALGSAEPNEKW
jgi:hypothetical protein